MAGNIHHVLKYADNWSYAVEIGRVPTCPTFDRFNFVDNSCFAIHLSKKLSDLPGFANKRRIQPERSVGKFPDPDVLKKLFTKPVRMLCAALHDDPSVVSFSDD